MARCARKRSESHTYHVILRGNDEMMLFEDDEDRSYFMDKLDHLLAERKVRCLAYVLLDDHVHLLLSDPDDVLKDFVKRLCISYAQRFNAKYERTGRVFYDRFKSENVESDEYLLTVYRYILKEPEKAGSGAADAYPWSSYREYADAENHPELSGLRELIGDKDRFDAFMKGGEDERCMESYAAMDDQAAKELIVELSGMEDPHMIAGLEKKQRNELLCRLKKAKMSIRQLERITGISRGVIQRA